jgi:hypothetical protein
LESSMWPESGRLGVFYLEKKKKQDMLFPWVETQGLNRGQLKCFLKTLWANFFLSLLKKGRRVWPKCSLKSGFFYMAVSHFISFLKFKWPLKTLLWSYHKLIWGYLYLIHLEMIGPCTAHMVHILWIAKAILMIIFIDFMMVIKRKCVAFGRIF